jgi:hypothetical protein
MRQRRRKEKNKVLRVKKQIIKKTLVKEQAETPGHLLQDIKD